MVEAPSGVLINPKLPELLLGASHVTFQDGHQSMQVDARWGTDFTAPDGGID
jgi:hypothetical protein